MNTSMRWGILVLLIILCGTMNAQKTREIGARFSGLNDIGAMYKVSKSEQKFLRFRLLALGAQVISLNDRDLTSTSLGGAIGIEKRKNITDKLLFLHGPEFSFSIGFAGGNSNSSGSDFNFFSVTPEIGYVLGVQYEINGQLSAGLEVIPSFAYSYTDLNNGSISQSLSFGASNLAALTLMYSFVK